MENKIPMHIDKEDPLYKAIFALPKTDLHKIDIVFYL